METTVAPKKPPATDTPRRRGKLIGSVVAVLAMAALAALAWYLTHRTPQGAGGTGVAAGAGAGRRPRRWVSPRPNRSTSRSRWKRSAR